MTAPSPSALKRRTRTRRALALGGMLAAVGTLVTVRSSLTPAPGPALGSSLAAPAGGSGTASSGGTSSGGSSAHKHAASPAAPQHAVTRQVTGNAYNVGYGVVQVRVSLKGSRITDVTALSMPQGGHSSDLSSYAEPQLRREALAAQSARIDTVSGASYTSSGYAASLQSALNKAGVR